MGRKFICSLFLNSVFQCVIQYSFDFCLFSKNKLLQRLAAGNTLALQNQYYPMCKLLQLLILILTETSCTKEKYSGPEILDTEKFTKVDNSSILTSLKPTADVDYVELRLSTGQGPVGDEIYTVREFTGDRSKLTVTCLDFLNTIPPQEDGFAKGCRPICYFHYLVTAKKEQVKIYNQPDKLLEFLGDIDSESDSVLLAFANGY